MVATARNNIANKPLGCSLIMRLTSNVKFTKAEAKNLSFTEHLCSVYCGKVMYCGKVPWLTYFAYCVLRYKYFDFENLCKSCFLSISF